MDGGSERQPERPAAAQFADQERQVRAAAAHDRAALDADALAADALVEERVAALTSAIDALAQLRWPARGPQVLAAATRALARERSRLDAAFLAHVRAIDDRDDVVPRARAGKCAATFLRHSLGWNQARATRECETAALLADGDSRGDLAAVGAAFAAGEISRDHVDVAVGVHRRLSSAVREALVPVVDPVTGEVGERRCIDVVDATLAEHARLFSVPELTRIGNRIVENLDPPDPADAHQRRYLHLSRLSDGSLIGRFACGPAQALALTAAVAAGSAPRPGLAVDADGVEHQLRDERTAAQRALDALVEAVSRGCHGHPGSARPDGEAPDDGADGSRRGGDGDEVPGEPDVTCDGDDDGDAVLPEPDGGGERVQHEPDDDGDGGPSGDGGPPEGCSDGGPSGDGDEGLFPVPGAPEQEGQLEIRRPPGVRVGPHPGVEIIVTATLEQLARALHHHARPGGLFDDGRAGPDASGSPPRPPGLAQAQHGGSVHPGALGLLACSGAVRRALLDEHGAVLQLGRSHRLATAAQKAALIARDVGCVIPGCTVPGERCEVHHVAAWADGGVTDVENLALLCGRHHVDVTDGTWEIEMVGGVPWARPPAWAHAARPLLRNASHRCEPAL